MKQIYFLTIGLLLALLILTNPANAAQTDITGPSGSGAFGAYVTVLPNGNIVVIDPAFDVGAAINAGGVFLYDGETLALISTLTGSATNDIIGNQGLTVLANGNFVVSSPSWSGAAGAATFCSAVTGCNGVISSSNSLVGTNANDQVSIDGIVPLTNGNYVVRSRLWNNGAINAAGAATWGNGMSGTTGFVSASNSLVGSTAADQVGGSGVTVLANGNYVVASANWDNGAAANAGAVTWGNGTSGASGVVSSSNSLVGSTANDQVGSVIALRNGHYVVASAGWDNGAAANAGAVTWGSGIGGTVGVISSANSLVGSTTNDQVGSNGVVALTNGNYVVASRNWNNTSPAVAGVGAATWGNGATGTTGVVSSANSLIGSTALDNVGNSVIALTNGNYVVYSPNWDNLSPAAQNTGAVTWGNGATGTIGTVSSANSLVGTSNNDALGSQGIVPLTNGNYVVCSNSWDNPSTGVSNVGAATWGNGASGTTGVVSSSNSLIGTTANDQVGNGGAVALTNGNYVVRSTTWNNGATIAVGAATWGNGATGTTGVVSSSNSLIGTKVGDQVGDVGILALTNGNYVVNSAAWDNGSSQDAGAATFGNGTSGTSGTISGSNSLVGGASNAQVANGGSIALTNGNYLVLSPNWDRSLPTVLDAGAVTWGNGASGGGGTISSSNSLVGSAAGDRVGSGGATALTNGNYVVGSPLWNNSAPVVTDASAFTFGGGTNGASGAITSGTTGGNSVVGTVANGTSNFAFDAMRNRLVVGRSQSNTVSILSFTTTAIIDGDLSSPANWSNGVPNDLLTGIIPAGRSMSISSVMNIGELQVQCGGNLTGGSAAAYIVGSVRKDFCTATGETFNYPIGDPGNYSPLTVSNTNGSGSLTASVTDTFLTGLPPAKSLSRYWSLTGTGITTDLTFNYTNADVNGTEANFRAFRRSSSVNVTIPVNPSSVNPAANTFTVTGVSQFSDWSAGDAPVVPSAANVSISGRVLTSSGAGLRNAIVYLTKTNGETISARTTTFGYYRFNELAAGETYIVAVASKRYLFATRIVEANDTVGDLDFIAKE